MGSIGIPSKRQINDEDVVNLKSLFNGTTAQVLAPTDDGYPETLHTWSKAVEKPSGVSILPKNAEEVSKAVKYAHDKNIDLAVRGGGHSTAGASTTSGGLLINLKNMRKVSVDKATGQVRAEGGCRWVDVDNAAWEHGLATPGGTVNDTGIGGLILGGGYGFLSGKHGLSIDNLVECTMVTYDGKVIKASKKENADLFWGLCGAGQNFGVVTEFVIQAHPQGDILIGVLLFPPTKEMIEKVVEVQNKHFTPVSDGKGGFSIPTGGKAASAIGILKPPPPAEAPALLMSAVFYDGPEEEGKAIFKDLIDIGPIMNTLTTAPYPTCNGLVQLPPNIRASQKGTTFRMPVRASFVEEVVQSFIEFTSATPDAAGSQILLELYDQRVVATQTTGCFANRGYHMNGLCTPVWSKAENDNVCRQWARDVTKLFEKELRTQGEGDAHRDPAGNVSIRGDKGAVMLYGNYDQYGASAEDIYGDNYPRLQQLKAKYDPDCMFDKLFPITPSA